MFRLFTDGFSRNLVSRGSLGREKRRLHWFLYVPTIFQNSSFIMVRNECIVVQRWNCAKFSFQDLLNNWNIRFTPFCGRYFKKLRVFSKTMPYSAFPTQINSRYRVSRKSIVKQPEHSFPTIM